jgi:protein-disulfide isomerase
MILIKQGKKITANFNFVKSLFLTLIIFLLNLFSYSGSAQAAIPNNSEFEAQVLQVIRNHPEVIVESVQAYQKKLQEEQEKTQQSFLKKMKANPKNVIGDSPTTGAANAKIILLEFSDFECPYCAQMHTTLKEFMAKHNSEVLLAYKHFPLLSVHPEALNAAKAAWAANQQGKFWEYHDALFEQQNQLGETLYQEIAKTLNLDPNQFNRDRKLAMPSIEKDMEMAQQFGIDGTPFFVINGETFSGFLPSSDLESIFRKAKG